MTIFFCLILDTVQFFFLSGEAAAWILKTLPASIRHTFILVLKMFVQGATAFYNSKRGLKLSSSFLLFPITTILGQ